MIMLKHNTTKTSRVKIPTNANTDHYNGDLQNVIFSFGDSAR